MGHTGNHQGHTHCDHEVHARPPTNANQTESGAGQRHFSAIETSYNPLHETVKDTKGCRLGRGKSWMGQAEDSVLQVCQLTAQANQGVGKGKLPKLIQASLRHSSQEKKKKPFGKAGKTDIKFLIQENTKLQDLIVYTDGSISRQRPVRVGLNCQARCDHHP